MDPLDDMRIDPGFEPPTDPQPAAPRREGWPVSLIVAIVAILALVAAGVAWWRGRTPEKAAQAPPQTTQPAAEVRAPLGPAVDAIDLPPLFLTDPLVRDLIGRLSSSPSVMSWLAGDGLVRNVVVCIENVSTGQSAARHLSRLAPKAPFRAAKQGTAFVLDPASYARYTGIADAVASLNPAGLARVYSTLKPRMVEAYRDLGHPEGDLDGATERAISVLLRAPIVDGDVALTEKVVSYKFQKDELEELDPAQKQLIRMGPRNQRLIQDQLRAIARELGIPDKRLPQAKALGLIPPKS